MPEYLPGAGEDKSNKIANNANNSLINLRNNIKKKSPKHESNKIIDTVETILSFNNQQKVKDFKY